MRGGGFRWPWLARVTNGRFGLGRWTKEEIDGINARVAARIRVIADAEHQFTERADIFGGYECSCGESWLYPMYDKGCPIRQQAHDRADALERGEV